MSLVMTDDVFKQLRDFIYEKSGIFVPDNKKYFLENRLGRRVQDKQLKGFEDYLYIVKFGADKNELVTLFNMVTTNETFFFREPQQFEVFRGELFNRIKAENTKSGRKDIRIWSAASSTGEEAYTLAMILIENPELKVLRPDISASDISESVLASARAGVYGSYAVRNVPENYMKKYFNASNQQFMLSPAVKAMVRFMRTNLVEDRDMKAFKGIDVIFCRNVLIYFDEKAKQKAVSLLYDALRPGGYLFVGTSESLHNITRALRPIVINKVIVYQKV